LLFDERARGITVLIAITAMLVLNLIWRTPLLPEGWEAEQTHIHRDGISNDLAEFEIEQRLQQAARASSAQVLVFPEGAVRRWTEATPAFWSGTLSWPGKTLVVGAGIPIAGSTQFENAIVIAAAHGARPFFQRIPVPIAMWNPLQQDGTVPIHLFGPGTTKIGRIRAAILICYEQLLVWPALISAAEEPSIVVAISNSTWMTTTVVPCIRDACARAWARLFGLPLISATNS
jgi:hypothetical protein